jgi:hypothetical protein
VPATGSNGLGGFPDTASVFFPTELGFLNFEMAAILLW